MEQLPQTTAAYSVSEVEEAALSTHRVKVFIALTVVIAAMGYLAFTAFQSATVYYYTVAELRALAPAEEGKIARVSGKLVPDSFARDPDSITARFSITDGTDVMEAVYEGVLPDLFFNRHSDIIIEGNFNSEGLFEGHNVFVKCPSKYIAAS